jgi:hypothetical protein
MRHFGLKCRQSHADRFSFMPMVTKSPGLKPIEAQNASSSWAPAPDASRRWLWCSSWGCFESGGINQPWTLRPVPFRANDLGVVTFDSYEPGRHVYARMAPSLPLVGPQARRVVPPFRFRVRFYLLMPEPGPVGVNVEPLGEAFGPSVLPEGLAVLLGLVTAPPAPELPVVVPFVDEPVVVPLAAEPPAVELPPAEPPEEPPLCASAKVLESAKAVASAIVVSFIVVSFFQ